MEHIKTFESYHAVNEEFLGLDTLWNKAKNSLSSIKDKSLKKITTNVINTVKSKISESDLNKIKASFDKLPENDKLKLANVGIFESMNESIKDGEHKLNRTDIINKIVTKLGLSSAVLGFLGVFVSIILKTMNLADLGSFAPASVIALVIGGIVMVIQDVKGELWK